MKIQFTNFLKTITTLKSIEPTTSHNTFYTDLLNNKLHALKYHILNSNTVSIKISKLYLNNPSIYKHRERQSVLKQVRDILSKDCVKLVDVGYVLYFMCSDIYLGMIYNGNGSIEGNINRCIDESIKGNINRCIDGYIEGNNNRYMDESIEGNGIESIEENINRYMDGNIEENNKRYMDGNIKGNNNRCIDDIYGHIEDMYIDNYKNQLSINNKLYSLLINIYNTSYQIESILHTTTYPLNIPNNLLKFKKVRDHLLNNLYNLDFYTVQDIYLKYLIFHTENNQFIKCIDLLIEYQYKYIMDFYSEYIKEKESEIFEGLCDKDGECSNSIISINNKSNNNIYRNTTSINNNSSNNIYNNITSSNNINSHNNNIYNNIHSSSNDTSKNNINSISINTILKIFKYIYKSSNSIKPKTMKHFSIFLNNTNFTSNTTHERMSIVPYLLDLYSLKTEYSFKYILYLIRLYFNKENNLVIDSLRNKVLRDLKSINRERDIGNDILVYVENNRITIENKLLDIYNQVDEDSSGHEDCYSRIDVDCYSKVNGDCSGHEDCYSKVNGDCSGHEDCYSRIDGDCYNDIRSCYNRVNGDYFRGIKSCYSKVNVIEDGVEENIYERHNDINNRLNNDKVNSFITTNTISLINKNHIKILIKYIKIFINIIESFNQFQYLEYKSKVDDIFNILKYIYNLKIKYIKDRFYNKIRELVIDLYKSVMSNERKNICSDNMNLSIGNDNRNVYSDNMNCNIDNNNLNCSIDNINLRFDNNNRNVYSDNMNCNIDDNINCNSIKDIIDNIFYNLLLNEEIRNIYLINKKFPRRVLKNVKINIRNKKERTLYRYIRKIYKEKVDEVKDEFIRLNENLLNINKGTMNVEGNIDLEDISNIGEDIMNKEGTLNSKDIINVGNTMNNKDIMNSGITTKDNFIKGNNNKNSQIKDNNRKKSHDKYNNISQIKDNNRKKSHDKYNNNSQIKDNNNKKYHSIDKNETSSSLSTSSLLSILTSISTSLSLSFKTLKNIKIIHNFTKHDTILSPILISIKKTLLLLYKNWSTLSKHQRHNLIKIYPVIYKYCKMYKIEICKEIKKSLTLVWKLNLPILKYKHIKLFVDEMSSLREYEDKKEIINIHKEVYETIERYKVDYEMKIKDRNVLEREVLYRNVLERDVHREVLDMKVVEGKIYSDDKDEKRETGKIVDISKLMKTDDKDEKIVDRNNKYKIESSIEDEIIKSDKLSSSIKSLSLIQDLIQHINNSLREQLNYFYKIQSYLLSTSKIYTDTEFNNKIYQIINILNSKQILLEDIIKYKNYDLIQNFLKLKLEDLYTKHNLYKNKVLKKIQELKIRFSKLYFVSDEDLLKGKYRDIIRNIYFVDDILISSDDKDCNEGICSINGNGYKNCNCIDNQNGYVNDNGINIDQINIKKSYDNINSTYYCIGIISKGEEFIFINRIPLDNTLEFLIEFDKEFQYSLNEYYKKKRVDISIIRDTILEVEYFKSVERTLRDGDMIEGDLKDDKEECGDFRNGDMIEGDFKDSKEEVEYFRNGDLIEEDFREGDLIKGDLKDDKKVERHENTNKDCMEEKYANKDCMKEEIAIQNNNNLVLSNSILNNIKPYKTTTSKIKYLRKYKNNYYTINPSNIYYYPPSSIIYTSLTNTIFNKISLSRNKHFILYGESSTGKTETVKYYCRSIGKQVYVFCCNELITLDLLNNIIHGCRINGYYLCMDEFNRLSMEVITKLEFPDDLFVFITVNLGYLGRVDIFDCVDDNERVCEDVNENGHKDNINGSAIDDEVNKSSIYDNENNIDCSVKKLINYNNNNSIKNTSIDNNNNNINKSTYNNNNSIKNTSIDNNNNNINKSTSINNNNIKDIYQIRNDLLNTMYSKNSNTFINKCTLIRVDNPNIKDIILDTINKELIPVLFDIIDTFNITLTLRSLKYFSTLTNIYYYVYSSLNENDRDRFTNKYKIKRPSYKELLEYGLKYSNGVILVGETKTGKSLLIREYLNIMEEVNVNGLNCEYKDGMNDDDVHSNINSIHKSQSTIDLNSDSNINTSIHNINDTTSNKNLTQNTNGTINNTLYKYFYKYDELELYNYIKSIDNFNITRYIIYDCVLDSRWIENLNSVLDDNKILCIKTGETVRVDNIKFIFESNDLSLLTPATLTRVFVVNMYEDSSGDSVCNCNGNGIIECNCEVYDNKDKYISGYEKCNTGNNMIENICSDKKSNKRNIMIENKIKSIYSDKKTFHNIATLDIKSIKDKNQLLEILHEQRVIFIEGELGVGKRAYVNNLICQYNGELDEGNRDCLNNNNLLENNKNGNMVDGKIDKGSKVNEESINEKIGSYNRILSINNIEKFTQCNTSIPSTNSNSIKSTNNNIHSTNDSGRSLNDNIHTIDSSMKSIKYNIDNNVHFIYKSIKEIYSLDKLKSYKYYILDDYEDCTIDVYEEIRLLYEYNTLNIFLIILYNGTNLLEINKKRRIKSIIFQMIRNTTNESKMEYDNNTSKTINKYNDECILEQINFYLKRQIKLIILGEYLSGKAYIINRLENRDKVSCSKSKSLEESGTINNCITNNGTINNCITNNDNNNNINDNTNLIIKTYDINEINKQERRNRHIIKIEQYPYLVHLDEILENDYENILKYVKNIKLKECGCCILKYTKEIFYVEDDLIDKNKDGNCKVANNKDMACDRTIHKDFHINEYTLLEDNFNDKLHNDNIIYIDTSIDNLHNDNIIYKNNFNDKLHSDKIVCKNIPFFNLCSSIDGNKIILENKYKLYEFIHTTKKMYRNKKIIDEQIQRQRKIIEDKLEREREIYAEKINNCKIDIDKSLDVLKNRHTKDLVNVKTLILSNIDKIRNVLKIKNNYSKIKKELEEQQKEVKLNLECMNNDINKLVEKKREFSDKLSSIENKLKESYNKIMKINKKNLAELKSMNSPPLVVVYVVRVLKELLSCEEIVDEININSNGVDCSGNLCNDVMVDGNLCNGNNESLNSKFLDSLEHSTDDKKNSSSIEHSKNRKHKNNEFINNYKNKSNSSNFKKSTESWTSLKAFLRNADFINNLINVNTSSLSTITLNELRSKEQEIFKSSKICYIFYEYIVNKSEYDKIKQINSNINEDINKHDIEINKLSKLVQDEMKKDKEIKRQLFEIEQLCDESENELKLEENENILKEINFIKENSINVEISNCNITNNGIAMNRKENNSLDNKESLAMINNSLENNNTISLDTTVINNINKNTNLVDKDNIAILKDSANSTTINNSEYSSRSNIIDNINIKHFSTILNIEDIQYEYIQYTNCILLYPTLNINNSLIKDYIITDTRDSNFYTVLENTMKFKNNLIIKNVLKFDKSVYNLCKYQIENKTFKLVLEDVNSNYTHVGYFYNSFSILYNNRVSAKNNLNIHNEDILNIKSCEMLSGNKLLGCLLNGNKKLFDDILNGNELYNSIVDDNKFLEDYLDNHTIRKNQTMLNNLNSVLLKDRNPTSKEIAHQNIQLSSLKEFYETLLESNNNYKKINILHRKKYNLDLSRYVFNINNTKSYCLGEDFNILKSTDINYSHLILTNREEIIWYLKKINNKLIKISKKVYYIKNTRIIDLRDKFNKELFYEMCIEKFDCIEEDKCNNSKEYISSGNSNEYLNSNMNCKNNGIENSTTGYPYLCKDKIFSRCIEDNKDTINLHKYKNTLNNKLMCRHYIIKIHCDILENIYKFNLYNKYKLNKKDLEFMLNNYKTVNLKYLIELVYVNKIDIEDYKKVMDGI